jgi:hypothetical protein
MSRLAALTAFVLIALGGCGETVHVRLSPSSGSSESECGAAAPYIKSFYAELERDDAGQGLTFKKCSDVISKVESLSDLETYLAGSVVFLDVPTGGSWTIWVQGFPAGDCEKKKGTPLLCGTEAEVEIPPADDDEISINVNCVPPKGVWSAEALGTCRFP